MGIGISRKVPGLSFATMNLCSHVGATGEIRTPDLGFTKALLYQLSYNGLWYPWMWSKLAPIVAYLGCYLDPLLLILSSDSSTIVEALVIAVGERCALTHGPTEASLVSTAIFGATATSKRQFCQYVSNQHTVFMEMVGAKGFEPLASTESTWHSTTELCAYDWCCRLASNQLILPYESSEIAKTSPAARCDCWLLLSSKLSFSR